VNTTAGAVITVLDAVHTEAGIHVHKDVTIQGLSADRTVVQAHAVLSGAPDRVFFVPESASVSIKGLTIQHGRAYEGDLSGGGVSNLGVCTLEACVIRDNSANDGGGVFNHGTLTIVHCAIHGNLADRQAPPGYECGSGGGVKNGFRSTLIMENSTISGNVALGKGGGVFVACEGSATLTNCTISSNKAARDGGGVHVRGPTELVHCTVADNVTSRQGGGIYVRNTLQWSNCLVARNAPQDVTLGGEGGYQGRGTISAAQHNWVADASCPCDHSGDPLLDVLADNGGGTLTHALLSGSPAIDCIPATACSVPYDQRGQPRPIQVGSGAAVCDMGAFEWQP
jgi:parallel beta-helix repeat protein